MSRQVGYVMIYELLIIAARHDPSLVAKLAAALSQQKDIDE